MTPGNCGQADVLVKNRVPEEADDEGAQAHEDDADDERKFARDPVEGLTTEDDGGSRETELGEDVEDGEGSATDVADRVARDDLRGISIRPIIDGMRAWREGR